MLLMNLSFLVKNGHERSVNICLAICLFLFFTKIPLPKVKGEAQMWLILNVFVKLWVVFSDSQC